MNGTFDWDARKAERNRAKHGVTFEEAASAFADPHSVTINDAAHSAEEDRFLLLGVSSIERVLIVAHALRDDAIRIISARVATPRERRQYARRV